MAPAAVTACALVLLLVAPASKAPPTWAAGGPEAAGAEAPAGTAVGTLRGLRILYETTGALPGAGAEAAGKASREEETRRLARHEITVDDSGLRLVLLDYQRARPTTPEGSAAPGATPAADLVLERKLILRMDLTPPVIYELLGTGPQYREHAGDLNSLQEDRRITEKNELKLVEAMPRKEREAYFKENPWLRPDGTREVKIEREPGDEVLGRRCERVRVLENGRAVLDVQIAPEESGARSYYEVYRRLGAFSEEVLTKLSSVKGLPLRGEITVVTALPTRRFKVNALSLGHVDLPGDFFELPPGAVRIDAVPEKLVCAQCGKALECTVDEVKGKLFIDNGWLYFCSEEHADAYATARIRGDSKGGGK